MYIFAIYKCLLVIYMLYKYMKFAPPWRWPHPAAETCISNEWYCANNCTWKLLCICYSSCSWLNKAHILNYSYFSIAPPPPFYFFCYFFSFILLFLVFLSSFSFLLLVLLLLFFFSSSYFSLQIINSICLNSIILLKNIFMSAQCGICRTKSKKHEV